MLGATRCECPGIVGGSSPPVSAAAARRSSAGPCRSIACARARRTRASSSGARLASKPRYHVVIPGERCTTVSSSATARTGEHVVEDVVVAASPPVGGDRRRGFELDRHLADVSARPAPARGGLEHDAVVVAAGEDERAVPDERHRAMPVTSLPLVDVPRPGEERRLGEQVQEVVPRLVAAGSRACARRARSRSRPSSQKAVATPSSAIRAKVNAKSSAVTGAPSLQQGVGAKREPVRPPVVGDGEALGEIGLDLEVASDRDEPAEEVARDLASRARRRCAPVPPLASRPPAAPR